MIATFLLAMDQDALDRLRREAEAEMRRPAPDDGPAAKRQKASPGTGMYKGVSRFGYSVIPELEAGAQGFIVTCSFRKEKSATREALKLLRRYMPAELFPPEVDLSPLLDRDIKPWEREGDLPDLEHGDSGRKFGSKMHLHHRVYGCSSGGRTAGIAANGRHAAHEDGGDDDGGVDDGDDRDASTEEGEHMAGQPMDKAEGDPTAPPPPFALAKVGCRGVVVMKLTKQAAQVVDPAAVAAQLLGDYDSGKVKPRFCHRIVPLESTCLMTEAGLARAVASTMVRYCERRFPAADSKQDVSKEGPGHRATDVTTAASVQRPGAAPISFAVGYRSRSTEANKDVQPASTVAVAGGTVCGDATSEDGGQAVLLSDRLHIIKVVANGVFTALAPHGGAKVNLKKPEVAVLCEALPIAGQIFAGICVLDGSSFCLKPKLGIKPLIQGTAD